MTASPSEAAGQGVGYCVDGLSSTTCATTVATNPSLTVDLGEEMTVGNVLLDGLNVSTAFPLAVYLGSSSSNPLLNTLCGQLSALDPLAPLANCQLYRGRYLAIMAQGSGRQISARDLRALAPGAWVCFSGDLGVLC